jgi:hypothetical protein
VADSTIEEQVGLHRPFGSQASISLNSVNGPGCIGIDGLARGSSSVAVPLAELAKAYARRAEGSLSGSTSKLTFEAPIYVLAYSISE